MVFYISYCVDLCAKIDCGRFVMNVSVLDCSCNTVRCYLNPKCRIISIKLNLAKQTLIDI